MFMKTKIFTLLLALLTANSLWAYDFQIDDFNFRVINQENRTLEVYAKDQDIEEADIPETVTYNGTTYIVTQIRGEGFANCSNLTSITIPNSVSHIGDLAFSYCTSLKVIKLFVEGRHLIGEDNEDDSNDDDDESGVIVPPCWWCGSAVKIAPRNFAGQEASLDIFYGSRAKVTTVILGDGVTYIPEGLCQNMFSLTSIDIPKSVTSIEKYAFYDCSSLASITLPDDLNSIGKGAFSGCTSLESITIPDSVTNIEDYTFSHCSFLKSITLPNSVRSIGEGAFSRCSSLKYITIPNSVTSIGENVCYDCKNLEEIYCYPAVPPAVGDPYFYDFNYNSVTLYVPCDSKEAYEEHPVFGKFEKIKGIDGCGEYVTTHIYDTICQGDVYEFGEYLCDTTGTYTAFIDLVPTYLHLTVLPRIIDTITIDTCDSYEWHGKVYTVSGDYTYHRDIEDSAEHCYTEILHLTINKSTYEDVVVEAYDSYEWHGLVYTESGTYIYEEPCYQEILQLTIIDTPTPPSEPQDTTIYIYHQICEGETYIWMGMEFTEEGIYYEEIVEDENYIYHYIYTLEVLPSSIDTIVVEAYDSYEWHDEVYTESGEYKYVTVAANGCDSTEVLLLTIISSDEDEPNSPNKIYYTSSDGNIVIPNATDVFGAKIISNTYEKGQGVITFDGLVTNIGDYAFFYCDSLTSITLPNSVTSIGDCAFWGCKLLTSIDIPNSVTTIGEWTFAFCKSLSSVTLGNGVTSIGKSAFSSCKSLFSINIPNNVTSIGDHAFNLCDLLTSVTLGNSVTSIESSTFFGCKSLSSINIPNSVTSIGDCSFLGCSSLTSITLGSSVTNIGYAAFSSCAFTSITIPNSVTTIGDYAFNLCSSLTSITLGSSVTNIGDSAFVSCYSLDTIYCYAANPPVVESNTFVNNDETNNYEAKLYVPCESLEAYKAHDVWSQFSEIDCIKSNKVETDTVVIDASTTSVTITWPTETGADSYTIIIMKDGEIVCTLTFDSEGRLLNIAFVLGREGNHPVQYAEAVANGGYRFTVTGLEESTDYTYDIVVKNEANQVIETHSGKFTTQSTTAVENTHSQSPMTNCQKLLRNGQLIILRDGVEYNAVGVRL